MASARHWPHRTPCILAVALLATSPLTAPAQLAQTHTYRELSGTVTDGHEPLRGAIVQLEAEDSHEIITFLTEADGRYHFKRLNSNADYEVWVVFRNRHSRHREISKFDDHMDKVINFTIAVF